MADKTCEYTIKELLERLAADEEWEADPSARERAAALLLTVLTTA